MIGDGLLVIDSWLRMLAFDRVDHELPGEIAWFLYEVGLPDEAREFHDRVKRMAPGSEEAQFLEILQAVALGETDKAVQLARETIEGGIGMRGTAWRLAWPVILHTSVIRGSEAQDIALFDTHLPGFSNLDLVDVSFVLNVPRINAFDVLQTVATISELEQYSKRAADRYRQRGGRENDYPLVTLDAYILFRSREVAVDWALSEVFSKPPTAFLSWLWRMRMARPFMASFMSEPKIVEARERWEKEEARIREEVRSYLQNR